MTHEFNPDPGLVIHGGAAKVVLTITPDGRLEPGEGLSTDEATRAFFGVMVEMWPEMIERWAEAAGWTRPG